MVRTQIQLTEQQAERAKQLALRAGVSMAEVIRRALEQAFSETDAYSPARTRALNVVGCVHSGKGDLAANRDLYLDEASQE